MQIIGKEFLGNTLPKSVGLGVGKQTCQSDLVVFYALIHLHL